MRRHLVEDDGTATVHVLQALVGKARQCRVKGSTRQWLGGYGGDMWEIVVGRV